MPEIICLISSSPPLVTRRSKTPPPAPKAAPKPRNGAAKLAPASTTFDLTGDTPAPAPKTKKSYNDSTFSAATSQNCAVNPLNASFEAEKAAHAADKYAKMNDKDFVFVDDGGYSSEIGLSKEYSLHLSPLKDRTRSKPTVVQAERNAPPSSPIAAAKPSFENPIEKASYKSPSRATTRKMLARPLKERSSRFPSTGVPKTALDKPSGAGKKEPVFLDHDFSSSIDLDKDYDLGLLAQMHRTVTPQREAYKMSERETKRHGLPQLANSPMSTRSVVPDKHGLPDLFTSPRVRTTKEPDEVARETKQTWPNLFSSPEASYQDMPEPFKETDKHVLLDPFSPSPKRARSNQAQVDASMIRSRVGRSDATKATASKTSLSKPLKRMQVRVLDSDPITFTSSPDFVQMVKDRGKRREQAHAQVKQLSDIDEPLSQPSRTWAALEALDTDSDDLPELPSMAGAYRTISRTSSAISYLNRPAPPRSKPLSRSRSMADPPAKPKKRVPKTDDEKAAEAAEKRAAKEAEADRKRLAREEKARDKVIAQDLAKVNMLKTDKKKSTPEMIVLFPQEMDKKLRETAEGFLSKLSVEYRNWAGAGATPGEVAGSGIVKNVVRWKRKVDAVHNEREDIWEPVPRRIENEKHALVHLLAKEFVKLAGGDEDENLNEHAVKLKSQFCDHKIIYLIEGLTSWQKKNASLRNRQFAAAVRAQADSAEAPSSSQTITSNRGRKKKAPLEYISDDLIEDSLLSLQIKHKVLIHHTASPVESAEWISIFTQHISTIPYRLQKMNLDTSFCMESGQVRAGEDARDTFVKMLCEMRGVTAPVGWGIEAEIGGGVKQLVERFRREGKESLAQAKKGANKDGGFTDRNVGKAISKRIHNVFMSRDPGSTDV